jgi:hypothetical protein
LGAQIWGAQCETVQKPQRTTDVTISAEDADDDDDDDAEDDAEDDDDDDAEEEGKIQRSIHRSGAARIVL